MSDTPLPNSTISPARDRRQAFVAARAGRTGINVALVVLVSCCVVGRAMQSTATYDGAMTLTVENGTFTRRPSKPTNGEADMKRLKKEQQGKGEKPRT